MTNGDAKSVIMLTNVKGTNNVFKFSLNLKAGANTVRFYLDEINVSQIVKESFENLTRYVDD